MEKAVAEKIMQSLLRLSPPFNELTEISTHLGSEEAGRDMRRKLAPILISIDDLMRPIIREFPDLDPDRQTG